MVLAHGARPRQLHWYHAGPMLFGDWGTSRLYVLGLAFAYTGRASIWFMLAMSALLVAVGWAYQVICRLYPDGGGVYSSARERSQTLAVIGALLLCADYIVTAALSALDAFHYLGVPHPEVWAAVAIALIGMLNFFGPTKAGLLALVVALMTIALSMTIGAAAVPHLSLAHIEMPTGHLGDWWRQFTALILAISGVEAVANMTGIMVPPVEKTSRRAIAPVLCEIVVLNLVLTLAMLALPLEVLGNGDPAAAAEANRDTMLRLLASHYIGPTFAAGASLVFAALLLSAVNTSVTDLVSIQFMMSRDKEMPAAFGGLNRFGMPLLPLVLGTIAPLATVLLVPDVGHLADLYAIGVVGAVAVNLGSCSTNWKIGLRSYERWPMMALAVLMIAIWFTIAHEKPHALAFALGIMFAGLALRWVAHHRAQIVAWILAPVYSPVRVEHEAATLVTLPVLGASSAATAIASLAAARFAGDLTPPSGASSNKSTQRRIMVSTRRSGKLLAFAIDQARVQAAELFVVFIRHVAVPNLTAARASDLAEDAEAQALFADAIRDASAAGVQCVPIYASAYDVGDTILEIAATHSVDTLILGATQRGALWRTMKGDVIQQVAQYLPERINLLIHG